MNKTIVKYIEPDLNCTRENEIERALKRCNAINTENNVTFERSRSYLLV